MRRALLLAVGLAACGGPAPPQAVAGVLDLRGWDFERDGALPLRGRWELRWQELIPPGAAAKPDAWLPIRKWNGLSTFDGHALPGKGFATYRLRVRVPEPAAAYAIFLDPIIDACRLWVTTSDGKTLGPIGSGEVGATREASRGALSPSQLEVSGGGELTLTLQVSNFEHARGGSGAPPLFGTRAAVDKHLQRQRMGDFFYIGLLFVIGLHHVWLFLLRRRERAALWFAVVCLLIGLRAFLLGRYLMMEWPGAPAWIPVKLEYLTFYVGLAAGVAYLGALFPKDLPRGFVRAVQAAAALFSAGLLLPKPIYSAMVEWFQIVALLAMVVGIRALVRAMRRERDVPPLLVLLGLGALSVATVIDILREQSLLHTRFTAHYGVAVFVLFQSALLALLNQRRATQLEARNLEVQRLNEELRRQIASRSHELSQLVMMVARGGGSVVAQAGLVIAGQYKIIEPLGEGAMGSVFSAERLADGKRVALKVIRGATTPEGLARFAREAEVAAAINHPNVVAILDFGVNEAGVVYIVMELIEGRSLEEERPRFGDVAWALPLLGQLAGALEAIHAREVIHRDIKPSNLLVADGRLVLADFGVAHLDGKRGVLDPDLHATKEGGATAEEQSNAPTLTRAGMLIGSPMYMAPEMAGGAERATTRSDMFSFGLIAYELLSARRAWSKPVVMSVLDGSDIAEPPRLDTIAPSIDSRLASLIEACLRVTAAQRPSASELCAVLAPARAAQRRVRSE